MCDDCEDMMWEAGKKFERERIIALLETKGNYYRDGDMWADAAGIDDAIALINGEVDA